MTSVSNVTMKFPIVFDFLLSIANLLHIDTLSISLVHEIEIAFAKEKAPTYVISIYQEIYGKLPAVLAFNC